MFEQAFKNIDDVLWKEAGCTTELDYTEQSSWLLFLKYLDGLEQDRADMAALDQKKYSYILDKPYRWEVWAAPKGKDGKIDHHKAMTGDDLRDFVNGKLFPYLHGFKEKASGPNTIEYKIGEIFGEIKNRIQSGYNLREVIDHIDELRFRSQTEKHELSHLYEAKIKNMGNAGRNGGEYYTPRPLIRAIVRVVKPKIGERIYDGACGSAGFLCESFDYLKAQPGRGTKEDKILQERTFYGKEKKSLAYVIAIMNMILHGIEAPNIVHANTLSENIGDIQDKDRFDVVLANPPFGGKERKEVQQNFPIRTGETAFLFLQHFIKILKPGGRGGVVIKNTFLSNTDNASVSLRKLLLESCNLHTVTMATRRALRARPLALDSFRITDIQDDHVAWEAVPYCKIDAAELPKYRLASGDIVFARTGATTGKSFLVSDPPDAVFASYLIRLRLLEKKLLPEFVSLFFQTSGYWKSIKEGSSGSAQGGFNATKLGALSIPIPPLPEQRRIVGILDRAFDGIATAKANAEKNLQNARDLFDSHLQAVFTQRGEEWVEKCFADVCEISSVLVDPRLTEYQQLLHVGGANIETKTGVLNDLKTAQEEGLISGKFLFDETMVLYS